MSIDPMKIDAAKVLRPDQPEPPQQPAPSSRAGDPGSTTSADQVILNDSRPRGHSELLRQKELYGAVAGEIREKDQALEALGQKVGALKEPLQAIVKQFPPYGKDDEERVKFLKQYASLRKVIDALTVPRPDGSDASPLPPPLPPDVTDSQISDHIAGLDDSGARFGRWRQAIAADAALMAQQGGLFGAFSHAAPPSEGEAVQKSIEVGQQIAVRTGEGVTPSNSHFLRSLG